MTEVQKFGQIVPVSREFAILYGIVQPTPEERAEMDAELARFHAERDAAQPILRDAIRALDAVDDALGRIILDLHQRVPNHSNWRCEGCNLDGYEAEPPEWPCDTTVAIAEHYGIAMPDRYLLERPLDGSLDAKTG